MEHVAALGPFVCPVCLGIGRYAGFCGEEAIYEAGKGKKYNQENRTENA
jgi:hypothetical protein